MSCAQICQRSFVAGTTVPMTRPPWYSAHTHKRPTCPMHFQRGPWSLPPFAALSLSQSLVNQNPCSGVPGGWSTVVYSYRVRGTQTVRTHTFGEESTVSNVSRMCGCAHTWTPQAQLRSVHMLHRLHETDDSGRSHKVCSNDVRSAAAANKRQRNTNNMRRGHERCVNNIHDHTTDVDAYWQHYVVAACCWLPLRWRR